MKGYALMPALRTHIKTALIFVIRLYQKIPHRSVCRFEPSCSAYTIMAIEKHGCVKGAAMGVWRILRCNPFVKGGVDYP